MLGAVFEGLLIGNLAYDERHSGLAGDSLGQYPHPLGWYPEPQQVLHRRISSLGGKLEVGLCISGLGSVSSDDEVILRPSLEFLGKIIEGSSAGFGQVWATANEDQFGD